MFTLSVRSRGKIGHVIAISHRDVLLGRKLIQVRLIGILYPGDFESDARLTKSAAIVFPTRLARIRCFWINIAHPCLVITRAQENFPPDGP